MDIKTKEVKRKIKAANEGALIQKPPSILSQYGHVVVFVDFKGTWSPFVTPLICSNAIVKLEKFVLEFTSGQTNRRNYFDEELEIHVSDIDLYTESWVNLWQKN